MKLIINLNSASKSVIPLLLLANYYASLDWSQASDTPIVGISDTVVDDPNNIAGCVDSDGLRLF